MTTLLNRNDFELAMYEKKLTLATAMKGTVVVKLAETDEKSTVKIIVYLLSRLQDNFNIREKLSDQQKITIALDLIEIFSHDTIEDILLMMKYIRQGRLGGRIYRLDGYVILNEWVPAYKQLKADEREHIARLHKSDNTIDLKTNVKWTPENKAQIQKLKQNIIKNIEENKKNNKGSIGSRYKEKLYPKSMINNIEVIDPETIQAND